MELNEINSILDRFRPVGLEEIDSAKLMNRIDRKYVLAAGKIPQLLSMLNGGYRVLEINNRHMFSYSTTYLDTEDFVFFKHHLTGKLERNKVRYRKYDNTDTIFLEVKRKTNKNRTIKWRIITENEKNINIDDLSRKFLSQLIPFNPDLLKPVLLNNFNRITLVNEGLSERVTIDLNISFSNGNSNKVEFPFLGIVEVKKGANSYRSATENALKELNIRPSGFSKYCIGSAMVHDIPRKNILKQNFLHINKIKNEYFRSVSQ
jgi:hypothetical protein